MTRWTPALLEQVRDYARAGHSMRQCAEALGLRLTTLATKASEHKIAFHGKRGVGTTTALRAAVRAALDREIEAARREAPKAPLYRNGP